MKNFIVYLLVFGFVGFFLNSCNNEGDPNQLDDNFDRTIMLEDWSNNIIIPTLEAYFLSLETLVNAKDEFLANGNNENLENLRISMLASYKLWQRVSMFDIGKAEEIQLRNYTNIFPTDVDGIKANIQSQDYNLELPSNFDKQGFPALDYLLFGSTMEDSILIDLLNENDHAKYLSDIVERMHNLTNVVLKDWKNTYQSIFISNSGSSGTASVDKVVNDFLFYYEKFFRAGKVGIPAGIFSGNPIAGSVEAPYANVYSKELFFSSLDAIDDFFNGRSFDGQKQVISIASYLDHVQNLNQSIEITTRINNQFDQIRLQADRLSGSFKEQVDSDNNQMLLTYDEIQKVVVILKVEMMQALNIQVDYVDADGD